MEDALKSQDLNLLLLAIKKILVSEKLSDFEVFELFSKNKEGVYALINYYRMFNPSSLVKYYNYLHNPEAIIMEYIRMAFADRKYENMQKLLFAAGEQLKALESGLQIEWRKDIFRRMF